MTKASDAWRKTAPGASTSPHREAAKVKVQGGQIQIYVPRPLFHQRQQRGHVSTYIFTREGCFCYVQLDTGKGTYFQEGARWVFSDSVGHCCYYGQRSTDLYGRLQGVPANDRRTALYGRPDSVAINPAFLVCRHHTYSEIDHVKLSHLPLAEARLQYRGLVRTAARRLHCC